MRWFQPEIKSSSFNNLLYMYKPSVNNVMDYLKKSLNNQKIQKDYEEIDTRLASGWYVDSLGSKKKKKYKTSKVSFKISRKI